ncbi:MAG: hypothetical protein II368_06905, partial [Clostridia bacterium]|nr:hypothetical protein [Clostridia bacterium]
DGDIHGSALIVGKWLLCSDIGAAFMSIDGLSHYYVTTKDERALALLTEMIAVFAGIDILRLKTQAHATLCAARGILRLYEETKEERLFSLAQKIWCLYQKHALTLTYQNLNWFSKGETWTEPCAIVDSLILALHLYALGGREEDLMLARRIWHNGMASAQRPNGGAGTDTCVTANVPVLRSDMYEAFFCCTMRLSEGFLWANQYADLLAIPLTGQVKKDDCGRYMDGDLLYAQVIKGDAVVDEKRAVTVNGVRLVPLVKYYLQAEEGIERLQQKILF